MRMPSLKKITVAIFGIAAAAAASAAGDGIPQRQVADMLYELAFANRTVYTRDIVQRLTIEDSVIAASEHYLDHKGLPLPAQMFRYAAEELDTNDFWWRSSHCAAVPASAVAAVHPLPPRSRSAVT